MQRPAPALFCLGYQSLPANVTASLVIDGAPTTVQPSVGGGGYIHQLRCDFRPNGDHFWKCANGNWLVSVKWHKRQRPRRALRSRWNLCLLRRRIYGLWGGSAPVSFFVGATPLPQSGTLSDSESSKLEGGLSLRDHHRAIRSSANATAGPAVVDGSSGHRYNHCARTRCDQSPFRARQGSACSSPAQGAYSTPVTSLWLFMRRTGLTRPAALLDISRPPRSRQPAPIAFQSTRWITRLAPLRSW
jgi:hypothetical protein